MKVAFITGAHGLLGSWLAKALIEEGVQVVELERDRRPLTTLKLMGLDKHVATVRGDVRDLDLIRRVIVGHEVDTVFHLAAITAVGMAAQVPSEAFDTNIRGTWTLLEACRAEGVEAVVVASSDKAYGTHEELPYTEHSALLAENPYDVSKACADMVARCYAHCYGLPVAVTRCANLYGGGDLKHSRLIPEAVSAVLAGRAPVIRSDGTPERDFLYVEDAVTGYIALANAVGEGRGVGEAFNFGSGQPHSVMEVVKKVCDLGGSPCEPEVHGSDKPKGEIDRQFVDWRKAREQLGWKPQVGLDDGLRKTLDWYRNHPEVLTA